MGGIIYRDDRDASTTVQGKIEIATSAEVKTGSSTTLAVVPSTQNSHASAVKAWVNFNGTGTVAVNASNNVSSITDEGSGDYTVNFTTAFADANYVMAGSAINAGGNGALVCLKDGVSPTTSACRILACDNSGFASDKSIIGAQFIGNAA